VEAFVVTAEFVEVDRKTAGKGAGATKSESKLAGVVGTFAMAV
jgi:hypothetical protein